MPPQTSSRPSNQTLSFAGKAWVSAVVVVCLVSVLLFMAVWESRRSTSPQPGPPTRTNGFTILFTGEILGYLEPCGCAEGQLGGFPRRASLLKSLRFGSSGNSANVRPLIVLDTGDLVEGTNIQDAFKFDTMTKAMARMGYDFAVPGEKDFLLNLSAFPVPEQSVPLLLSNLKPFNPAWLVPSWRKSIDSAGKNVHAFAILSQEFQETLRSVDPELKLIPPLEALRSVMPTSKAPDDFFILIAHAGLTEACDLATAIPELDVILASHAEEDPPLEPIHVGNVLIASAGKFGKYLCRLDVDSDPNMGGPVTKYSYTPIDEEIQDDPDIRKLLSEYLETIRSKGLAELVPRLERPGGVPYVGNTVCKSCHSATAEFWERTLHAQALKTLEDKGHGSDPDCIGCHTVGYKFEGGFVSREVTPDLANVGCEACHGPGSDHAAQPDATYGAIDQQTCRGCHTPERSPHFDFATYVLKTVSQVVLGTGHGSVR